MVGIDLRAEYGSFGVWFVQVFPECADRYWRAVILAVVGEKKWVGRRFRGKGGHQLDVDRWADAAAEAMRALHRSKG